MVRRIWLLSTAVVFAVVSLTVLAPLAAAAGYEELARSIYGGFSAFCHQIPERSYFFISSRTRFSSSSFAPASPSFPSEVKRR